MSGFVKPIQNSLEEGDLGGINAALMIATPQLGVMGNRVIVIEETKHDYTAFAEKVIELIQQRAEKQGSDAHEAEAIQTKLAQFEQAFTTLEKGTLLQRAQELFFSIWD